MEAQITFAQDIRPLFGERDIKSMSFAFDLSSCEDVRVNADEITALLGDDVDRRLQQRACIDAALCQRLEEIVSRALGLRRVVTRRDGPTLLVEWTGTGRENEAVSHGRVVVRRVGIEAHRSERCRASGRRTGDSQTPGPPRRRTLILAPHTPFRGG